MATVHTHTPCQLHGASVQRVRKPFRVSVIGARAPAARHGLWRAASHKLTIAAAAPVQQTRQAASQLVRTVPAPQEMFVLPRSQLANKQVVTRTKGFILGVVDHLIADPQTLKVVALSFKKPKDLLPGDDPQQIGLLSLRQIADVLLVHDERCVLQEPLTSVMGYVKVVGTPVKTSDGKVMGKVRDFEFSPDDGRITSIIIDKLGIPALPEKLFACYKISAQDIASITWSVITLQAGAEINVRQLSGGFFDGVTNLLPSKLSLGDATTDVTPQYRDDPEYVQWYVQNGMEHEAYTGQALVKPSPAALDMYYKYARGGQKAAPSAPQALPPARQPEYAAQLQPQVQYDSAQLQYDSPRVAEPAGWAPQQQVQMQGQYPPQQQPASPDWSQPRNQPNSQLQANRAPEQRSPTQMQFQQAQPDSQQPSSQGRPWLEQNETPPKPREDWALNQAPLRQPASGSASGAASGKLEQQQRLMARAEGRVTETRFDPRRRTTNGAQPALNLSPQGQGTSDKSSPSQRPGMPQTRPSYSPSRQPSEQQQTSSSGQYQPSMKQPTAGSGYGSGRGSGSPEGRSTESLPYQAGAQGQTQEQWQGSAGSNNSNGNAASLSGSQNSQQPPNSSWVQAPYSSSNQPANVTADR